MYSLVENKLISIFHLFPSHPSAVCQEYVGPSASTFSLPQPPQKLGLLKPLRIFPEGKTTRIWTTTQSSNPRFFPAQENSQSASLCFISTAQRGFQRHMRESLQPATELSIHSEIHSTKEPGPSRVSVPFITVASHHFDQSFFPRPNLRHSHVQSFNRLQVRLFYCFRGRYDSKQSFIAL